MMSSKAAPEEFWTACRTGDAAALRRMLQDQPDLVHARDAGDNATGLHFAAGGGHLDSVRVLLDAGADVHGSGDVHDGDVIGWASRLGNEAVVDLLLARGARHHIFSAIATGDVALVRRVLAENPDALSRRRSRFEQGQTPLHAAVVPADGVGFLAGAPHYSIARLLIEQGADVNATDDKGRTPLTLAMLRDDREAMQMLIAAGATPPDVASGARDVGVFADSILRCDPMLSVPDLRRTIGWYESIGFTLIDSYADNGELNFAKLRFGTCEIGLTPGGTAGDSPISLWLFTDRIQDLYEALKTRQLSAARAYLEGPTAETGVPFEEDLYTPFYGGQQFTVRDCNGLHLTFWQPE